MFRHWRDHGHPHLLQVLGCAVGSRGVHLAVFRRYTAGTAKAGSIQQPACFRRVCGAAGRDPLERWLPHATRPEQPVTHRRRNIRLFSRRTLPGRPPAVRVTTTLVAAVRNAGQHRVGCRQGPAERIDCLTTNLDASTWSPASGVDTRFRGPSLLRFHRPLPRTGQRQLDSSCLSGPVAVCLRRPNIGGLGGIDNREPVCYWL